MVEGGGRKLEGDDGGRCKTAYSPTTPPSTYPDPNNASLNTVEADIFPPERASRECQGYPAGPTGPCPVASLTTRAVPSRSPRPMRAQSGQHKTCERTQGG